MSDANPEPRRWTRLTNPVTPTIVTFPGGDSAAAKPFIRVSNPVTPTVHVFPAVPELRITIRRHPESNTAELPLIAALVIAELSRLEQSFGGNGLQYDPDGSTEEPTKVVLRLFPKLIDGGAAGRVAKVAEELTRLMTQAREQAAEQQDADIRLQIARELRPDLSRAMMGVERVTVA